MTNPPDNNPEPTHAPDSAEASTGPAHGPWVIRNVDFEKSGTQRKHFPKDPKLPELAFVGRSNVGKSSLLNVLVNRKRLAHVSSTPGRTQLVNFFLVNGDVRLVDLPGYGFAKAPKEVKQHWNKMITQYLLGNRQLRLVVTLFDARRELTAEDKTLLDRLKNYNFPFIAVITKADKLNRSQQMQARKKLTADLAAWEPGAVVLFSAANRQGREELLLTIGEILARENEKAAAAPDSDDEPVNFPDDETTDDEPVE